jgi:exopolyphosphatase/guanosine-5'-triphosphate,3'-diphosphate pyrophosphatase
MGEESRELLQHAAHLHHIGSFLTFSGYQKHSHYLVRNADLIGFDEYEKMLISLIVLNHRGSLTRDKDPELANLNREQERDVIILATLLRLAENLDRGQAGVITDACISVEGKNGLVLEGRAARDPEVEVSGIESQRDVVKQVFGRDLVRHVYLDESAPPSAAARNSEERSVSL